MVHQPPSHHDWPNSLRSFRRRDFLHWWAVGALVLLTSQRACDRIHIGDLKKRVIEIEKLHWPHYRRVFEQKFAQLPQLHIDDALRDKIIGTLHRIYVDSGSQQPWYGSGFFIFPNVMVTAKHVVNKREILWVYWNNGDVLRNFVPKYVCVDDTHDIAFLMFDTPIGANFSFDISELTHHQVEQTDWLIGLFAGYGGPYGEVDTAYGSVTVAPRTDVNFSKRDVIDDRIKALFPSTAPVRGGSSWGIVISVSADSYGKLFGNLIASFDIAGRPILLTVLYEVVWNIKLAWERCKTKYGW